MVKNIRPWMVNNAMFIILIIGLGIEMLFMLDEIYALKEHNLLLERRLEEKLSSVEIKADSNQAQTVGLSYYIVGAVSMSLIVIAISYFGGIDPDAMGGALNSLGDQTTALFGKVVGNTTDKIMGLHHGQAQLTTQISNMDERVSGMLANISSQISDLNRPRPATDFYQRMPGSPRFR